MDNNTAALLGSLFGAVVTVSVGALVAQYAIKWLAGFRPRYPVTLLTSIVGYGAAWVIGLVLGVAVGVSKADNYGSCCAAGPRNRLFCAGCVLLIHDQES